MKQISSVDLYYLTKEFEIFKEQRIDSFYYEDEIFYIKFYVKRKGPIHLINKLGKYIYFDKKKPASSHPINFIQYLRKYLKNSYLMNMEQISNERILKLSIDKKQLSGEMKTFYLFIELFSKGNIIITDQNLSIINSLFKQRFKDRTVLVKSKYELPPQKELTIFDLDKKLFISELKKEKEFKIGAFLATRFGIGGKFSREVCTSVNIDKNKFTTDMNEKEIKSIIKELKSIINKETKASNIISIKNKENKKEETLDFFPFELKSNKKTTTPTETFNDAIKNYYKQFLIIEDKHEKTLLKELIKLKKRLGTQKKHKEKVLQNYEKFNNLGNIIYNNYALVEELLSSINKSAKEKGWKHVKETIKNNEDLKQKITTLNYKNNEIILELE